VTPRTYHCEGGREEAEGIDDWCNDTVGQTLDMLPDILARRDQQGGHQEHHEGPSIVQLEHYVIDDHPRDIELEVLPHRTEGIQHCSTLVIFLGLRSSPVPISISLDFLRWLR